MRLTGPSKAGKSFALIELCIAIAEGKEWLGMRCRQGAVLYINLELDRASCLHRFKDVYTALGWNDDTVRKWLKRSQKYQYYKGLILLGKDKAHDE